MILKVRNITMHKNGGVRMSRRVLVIAPHPDDETLGVGGTLLKLRDNGYETFWVIFTKADETIASKEWLEKRKKEIEMVAEEYRFSDVFELGFITTKLDTYPIRELIKALSDVIQKAKPEIVFVNHPYDIHSDHKIVFQVAMSSLKTFRAGFVKKILSYETITETDQGLFKCENSFIPNSYIDISSYIDKKLEIMSIYESEVMDYPLPRSIDSIKALNRYRGSFMGYEHAEAFYVLRERWL